MTPRKSQRRHTSCDTRVHCCWTSLFCFRMPFVLVSVTAVSTKCKARFSAWVLLPCWNGGGITLQVNPSPIPNWSISRLTWVIVSERSNIRLSWLQLQCKCFRNSETNCKRLLGLGGAGVRWAVGGAARGSRLSSANPSACGTVI